jgi:hypothetical protein
MQIVISSVEKLKYPHMNIKYDKNHRDGLKSNTQYTVGRGRWSSYSIK